MNHWPFPAEHLQAGYCYIITHPGSPCIFYDHFVADGLGQTIRELVTIRQKMRIHCRSKVRLLSWPVKSYVGPDLYQRWVRCFGVEGLTTLASPSCPSNNEVNDEQNEAAGPSRVSVQVVIQKATSDVYAASIDNRVAMKVGPGDWSPAMVNLQVGQKEWVLQCSGPQFAVWEAMH